jgi:DNA-binding MarR family transcriptional regulator
MIISDLAHLTDMRASSAPEAERTLPPALLERIGFLLAMTKGGAEGFCTTALAPLGLHVRQFGLLTVLAAEGPRSQQELADWVRMDRTTMVGFIDGLEEAGYVRRERNPSDRRAYLLQLTPEGRKVQKRAERLMLEAEDEFLAELSEAEREQLLGLLAKLAIAVGRPPSENATP